MVTLSLVSLFHSSCLSFIVIDILTVLRSMPSRWYGVYGRSDNSESVANYWWDSDVNVFRWWDSQAYRSPLLSTSSFSSPFSLFFPLSHHCDRCAPILPSDILLFWCQIIRLSITLDCAFTLSFHWAFVAMTWFFYDWVITLLISSLFHLSITTLLCVSLPLSFLFSSHITRSRSWRCSRPHQTSRDSTSCQSSWIPPNVWKDRRRERRSMEEGFGRRINEGAGEERLWYGWAVDDSSESKRGYFDAQVLH